MKIALLCDTHFGARNEHPVLMKHQEEFFTNTFFPYITENKIKTVFHLGDTFDRRKFINFVALQKSKNFFFNRVAELKLDYHMITGNHDVYHRNTNDTNSIDLLLREYSNFKIYQNDPVELTYGSTKIVLCPWLNTTNEALFQRVMKDTKATAVMGHFDIVGFEMIKGALCTHGLDKKLFEKFESVYSGHFHHPSEYGNIKYLGAQYEMNWSDYDGRRGFHVYDTESRDLEFVENPERLHHKIIYEDTDMTVDEIADLDLSTLKDKFVKVIVKNRTKPYIFDLLMEKIAESGVADLKSVEDSLNFDNINLEESVTESKDTRFILHEYVDAIDTNISKARIKTEIDNLYMEALNLE